VCQKLASAGEPCGQDCDCAPGLGCSSTRVCGAVTWVAPGGTCSPTDSRCLVGSCAFDPVAGVHPPPLPDGGAPPATCPRVIADGDPCALSDALTTCDTFSQCFQGACALMDSVVCR
jgi:hypothetical protein